MSCLLHINLIFVSLVSAAFLALHESVSQDNQVVTFQERQEREVTPGRSNVIVISFIIKEGYHIQADEVKDENLIPTSITLQTSEEIKITNLVFPEPEEFAMAGVSEPLMVFSGFLDVRLTMSLHERSATGLHFVEGILNYQACDSRQCLFPRSLPFTIKLNVTKGPG